MLNRVNPGFAARFAAAAVVCFSIAASCGRSEAKGNKGPYVQNVTGTTAVICWETDEESGGLITLKGGGSAVKIAEQNDAAFHEVALKNLKPGVSYQYEVTAGKLKGAGSFTTDPMKAVPFTFAVYGDTRSGHVEHKTVAGKIKKAAPALVLNTGDLVGDGTKQADWDMFWKIETPLAAVAPYYPTLGNHEKESASYYKYFSLPDSGQGETDYAFSYAGAYFIALDDSTSTVFEPKQVKWLKKQLEAGQKYDFIFVFLHQPPYSSSKRDASPTLRRTLGPLFKKYGVSAVFSGHDHFYERLAADGIPYIIAGGGGAPLYDFVKIQPESLVREKQYSFLLVNIKGKKAVCEARNISGAVIDKFEIVSPR